MRLSECQLYSETFIDDLFAARVPQLTDAPIGRPAVAEALTAGGYPEAVARQEPRRRGRWFEVKLGATAHSRDFGALRHLQSRLGKRFRLGAVVHTGSETLRFGPDLWALPVSALWTRSSSVSTRTGR